jgi:hypothetical protein
MGIYSQRVSSPTVGRGHINRTTIGIAYAPQGRRRTMRQDRAGTAGQNCREPTTFRRKQRVPHRIDTLVHLVQATRFGAPICGAPGDTKPTQLLKRHEPVLALSNSRNRPLHPRPTGLKVAT